MFGHKPIVSIIIPVFNRLQFLGPTIESVLAQTLSDWELLVVDDGSVEDVGGFVARYPDSRIGCVHQENQGNAVARNTGISHALGQYLICLDSDDVLLPDMLDACVARMRAAPPVDVVYVQWRLIDAKGKILPLPIGPDPKRGTLLEDLLLGFPILPSAALVRRRCFEQWGSYEPGLDDWEMWLRWALHGCQFECIERALLYYRIHEHNFNWDWSRRRRIHHEMLDKFYSQPDLPPWVVESRSRAYAQQFRQFAFLAWRLDRPRDGIEEFIELVLVAPENLYDLSFYFALACAYQDPLDHGTNRNLDLVRSQEVILQCLNGLYAQSDLPDHLQQRRSESYAWAYLALGQLAYGVSNDMKCARSFLLHSFISWPSILFVTNWSGWYLRSQLGYHRLQNVKSLVGRASNRNIII